MQQDMFKKTTTARENFEGQKGYINKYLIEEYSMSDISNPRKTGFVDLFRILTLALFDEVAEILGELPWKPWKKGHNQYKRVDFEKLRYEIVDAQFFVNQMVMMAFDSFDQYQEYFDNKLRENIRRQEEGYSYIPVPTPPGKIPNKCFEWKDVPVQDLKVGDKSLFGVISRVTFDGEHFTIQINKTQRYRAKGETFPIAAVQK